MKLRELLSGVELTRCDVDLDVEISQISYDTREMTEGGLFAALSGYETDGNLFIPQALAKGAVAVLCGTVPEGKGPWLAAAEPRLALAQIACNFYGNPGREMTLIAVTGTNGKTTTTYLVKAMLEGLGYKVGLIGTNQNLIGNQSFPAERTTPESVELQGLLRKMADAGCTHVVMEASSIALELYRTGGLRFTMGIFTNLTRDHLDFHGTMGAYEGAKRKLFDQCDLAILNLDDPVGRRFAGEVPCPVFTYSERHDEADLVAKAPRLLASHVEFEVVARHAIGRVFLPIPGGFTIYNALAAVAVGLNLGLPIGRILATLRVAPGVKGRMEVLPHTGGFTVVIDYAHTPDALEKALTTLRDLTHGRLICLFGCGGDRDRTKRAVMGEIAGNLADLTILTSDNPRSEDPMDIIGDILPGLQGANCLVEPDREAAIALALETAETGDVVLLAGKGHETYQEIAGEVRPLDEREVVARWQEKRSCKKTRYVV